MSSDTPSHSAPNAGTATVNCPHCQKLVEWSALSPFRPFCSERCKLIDLGAWADESHRIPGEEALPFSDDE